MKLPVSSSLMLTDLPAPPETEVLEPADADRALVAALRAGDAVARAGLFDRYGGHVQRVLVHLLGADPELPDLIHEVFVRCLAGLGVLRDEGRLKGWLTGITVHVARGCLRTRARRRWLRLEPPETMPEPIATAASPEVREAVRHTWEVLAGMPTDERIVFSLRYVDGMELKALAEACQVSLSTAKRRLARAERRFVTLARSRPVLASWLADGTRWRER